MATIASLAVKLTADIGSFGVKLKSAAESVSHFSSEVTHSVKHLFHWSEAILALAAGGSLEMLIHSQMEAIDQMSKFSDVTGVATEDLAGLHFAASLNAVSAEALDTGLKKMLITLGQGATDIGQGAEKLAKFGLNAQALAAMRPADALGEIADKFKELKSPAERAALAVAVFGKSGVSLAHLLMQGSEGLAEMQAEAEELGLTFNRVDGAKVEAAVESLIKVKAVFTGIGRTLAVDLAPFITALGERFIGVATHGESMSQRVTGAFEWIVKAVASAADYVELLRAGFLFFKVGALAVTTDVLAGIDNLGWGITKLLNLLPGVDIEWTNTFADMADAMAGQIMDATDEASDALATFAAGTHSAQAAAFFDDLRAKAQQSAEAVAANAEAMNGLIDDTESAGEAADGLGEANKKVGETIAELEKQVRQLGMTEAQKKLDDLAMAGASADDLAHAKDLLDMIEAAKAKPEKLASAAAPIEVKTPELLRAGSAAAQRAQFEMAGLKRLSNDQLAKQQIKEQQTGNDHLKDIADNTEALANLTEYDAFA